MQAPVSDPVAGPLTLPRLTCQPVHPSPPTKSSLTPSLSPVVLTSLFPPKASPAIQEGQWLCLP